MRRVNPNTRHFQEGIARFPRLRCFRRIDALFRIGPIFCCRLHNKALELIRVFATGTRVNADDLFEKPGGSALCRPGLPAPVVNSHVGMYDHSGRDNHPILSIASSDHCGTLDVSMVVLTNR